MPATSNAHTRTPHMHATTASQPAPLARMHATDPLRHALAGVTAVCNAPTTTSGHMQASWRQQAPQPGYAGLVQQVKDATQRLGAAAGQQQWEAALDALAAAKAAQPPLLLPGHPAGLEDVQPPAAPAVAAHGRAPAPGSPSS
jgi:hypothetical protein